MDKRVYLVTKRENSNSDKFIFCGIYTNRKILIEQLATIIKLDQLYIKGPRKNKQVNDINLGVELQKPIKLNLYDIDTDQVEIQIGTYGLNHTNPKLIIDNNE